MGAEVINFDKDDPIETIMELTGGIGPDRIIDAVGVDAFRPKSGPATEQVAKKAEKYDRQVQTVAPERDPKGSLWKPGNAPSLVAEWAVQSIAKAGTLSIIGVYPETVEFFPIGMAMNKNLTIKAGNCNHRKYIPELMELVQSGAVEPAIILSHIIALDNVIQAYEKFDQHEPGWIKVELTPAGKPSSGEDSD